MDSTQHQPNDTNGQPTLCLKGCGFFGNPMFGHMCSKCFKETEKDNAKSDSAASTETEQTAPVVASPTAAPALPSPTSVSEEPATAPSPTEDKATVQTTTTTATETAPSTSAPTTPPAEDAKPVQANKARCFICKAKLPLAKQISNKCRCEYIYCDAHRTPAVHECTFDHQAVNKAQLEKQLPKSDRKGGSSFTRLE
jgi:type IV secretory pathway VirB10-like protein